MRRLTIEIDSGRHTCAECAYLHDSVMDLKPPRVRVARCRVFDVQLESRFDSEEGDEHDRCEECLDADQRLRGKR